MDMHGGQLNVAADTFRALVDTQIPAWRELPVRKLSSSGTVNALFRVGEALVARLPLRPGDVAETRRRLETEASAARELLGRARVPTPEPVAMGEPGAGYPLPWTVQTWLPGTDATVADPSGSTPFAHDLAGFIRDVRTIETRGRTFRGEGCGGHLPDQDDWMRTCFERSGSLLDVAPLRRLWSELRALPRGPGGDQMTHGDLIPGNVLVADGRLTGVIDVGGLGPADPAPDLVAAWHLLEPQPRRTLREALDCHELEWARGAAWAFAQAMGAVWYYADSNPAMSRMGRRTLERILADESHLP
jgi:aminoglycoside phosphotransferase (APT) family kinase protein